MGGSKERTGSRSAGLHVMREVFNVEHYLLNRRIEMNKQLLNVNEFADEVGVTKSCARRWILERKIASVKIGRLVKIPKDEIDRLITSGLRPARRQK